MLNLTVGQILDQIQPTVDFTLSMKDCIKKMIEYNKGYVVILKSDIPLGILTERDILNLIDENLDMEKICLEYATKNLVTIPPDKSVYFALNIMLDNNIRRIIITDKNGSFIGSITLKEILFLLEEDHFMKSIKLNEVISKKNPIVAYPDTSLDQIISIMRDHNIGSLPIVEKSSKKPIGIITERDILNLSLNFNPSEPVAKYMTANPITVDGDISVYEAIRVMEENKISRLVVVNDSTVVGIVNYRDIVKLLEENHKNILEKKLKHAKELLDLLPEMMIEIYDELDQQTIMWANKVAKQEFGNIVGVNIYTVIPKDYWYVIYSRLLNEKVVEKFKFENNGKFYQFSGTYLLLNNELGKGRIKALITDITKEEDNLRHIDKELRTYKKIINHADDLIIIYEAVSGKLKLYNDAVMRKLGYTSDELESMTIFDIVEEDKDTIQENIEKILRKNTVIKGRRFYREVYGEKLPVDIVATMVDFNSIPHILIVARDVSEKLKMEEEIDRKNLEMKKITEFILNLNRTVSEEEAYRILSNILINTVGIDSLIVYKINTSLNKVVETIYFGEKVEDYKECINGNLNQCKVILTNQPFLVENNYSYKCPQFQGKYGSYICMNVVSTGKVIGVVSMISKRENFFTEEKYRFIENVINAFSPFVSNLRLIELNKELSIRDSLTGLYNRRFIYEYWDKKAPEALRKQENIGILLIDADDFKKINDIYGHDIGDLALKVIAETIKSSVREMDIIGRWGGEEFIVILPLVKEDYTIIAERIRSNINRKIIYDRNDNPISLSVSIGGAVYPDDGEDLDKVISIADEKLYRAKREGKNKVII